MIWLWLSTALAGTMDLQEAIATAERSNAEVEAATWSVKAAKAAKTQAVLAMTPRLTVEAGIQWWSQPGTVDFSDTFGDFSFDGAEFPSLSELLDDNNTSDFANAVREWESEVQAFFEDNPVDVPTEIVLREQRTQSLVAQAVQPLTGAYIAAQGVTAANQSKRAAEYGLEATRDRIAVDTTAAYTQALAAAEVVRVSQAVVDNLESALQRIQAFEASGLVQKNERLQLSVALSKAKVELIKAQRGAAIAERALAMVIGVNDRVTPAPLPERLPSPPMELGTPDARADLKQIEAQVRAAKANKRVQAGLLLPQISAVARYERQGGVGDLGIPEQSFVGINASFDFWGMGAQNAAVRESHAQFMQAQAGERALSQAAEIEAQAAFDRAFVAWETISASVEQVEQAQENLRLVDARFNEQLSTTTDRLEAERLLAQARIQRAAATHDYVVARADWQRLTGQSVNPLGSETP